MNIILKFTLLVIIIIQPLNACRLWAVCARSDLTFSEVSEAQYAEIELQLNSFYFQSEYMLDGWALLRYNESEQDSVTPIYRSESPATNDSALYWNAVESLLGSDSGKIGIGHLRIATSGSNSVPNPHPWMFYHNDISYSFIHNGTVNKEILYDLITESGTDLTWLELYPPQTFGGGDWKSSGWTNVVDSELILLYIMKEVQYHEDIVIGFQTAVINMINAGTSASQLNLIFSDGGSLFVFGGSHGLYTTESSDYYSIMTQPPNNDGNEWIGIANEEMIVINSSGIVRYPDFVTNDMEDDHDIYPLSFTMSPAYPNPFNASVYFVLDGQTSEHVNISIYSIIGKQVDQFFIPRLNGQQSKIGWSPSLNVPSGTYFIQASTNYFNETQKILFIK
tara:strand:+ start:396 stop:1574 length:1179 start_codon:yes stop_codon:yes gene_type:complete